MKASEQVKAAGLKSLSELAGMSRQYSQTLINWHTNKPELFDFVLKGAVVTKSEAEK